MCSIISTVTTSSHPKNRVALGNSAMARFAKISNTCSAHSGSFFQYRIPTFCLGVFKGGPKRVVEPTRMPPRASGPLQASIGSQRGSAGKSDWLSWVALQMASRK